MTEPGLRERKKLATRRAITTAARRLVGAKGVDGVTVDEIADVAGVSPRTFFNYFDSKEEAVLATDAIAFVELGDAVRARPASETAVEALRAVLLDTDPAGVLERWRVRYEFVAEHPRLRQRHLATREEVAAELARALDERAGLPVGSVAVHRMLVAAVLAATWTGVGWWCESDRSRPLVSVVEEAFGIAAG